MKLVHWPLMGGLLHLVQRGGDWAGLQERWLINRPIWLWNACAKQYFVRVCVRTDDIEFADTPTHERHLVGSSPVLQCVVSGLPKPEVSWRFNRQRIDTGVSDFHQGVVCSITEFQSLSRVSRLMRDYLYSNSVRPSVRPSVCLSVCPPVRHVPVFCGNGLTFCHSCPMANKLLHSFFIML